MLYPLLKNHILTVGIVVAGTALWVFTINPDKKQRKFNRVQLTLENELPLKLQVINSTTESLIVSKNIKFNQPQDMIRVLKLKYEAVWNSVVEVCGFFKFNFEEFVGKFNEKFKDTDWGKASCIQKNGLIRFEWNRKFGIKQYEQILREYVVILIRYEVNHDYLSLLLQENRMYKQICSDYDLNEECLHGAHLRYKHHSEVSRLLKQIEEIKSRIVLDIDSLVINNED